MMSWGISGRVWGVDWVGQGFGGRRFERLKVDGARFS
jgi:hypothetical protein